MRRWLYAYRYVEAEPDTVVQLLLGYAPEVLQFAVGAADIPPAVDGSFVMDVETSVAGIDLAKQVRVSVGVAYRPDHRVVIPVRWHAEPLRRLFPTFDGALEVEPHSSRLTQLTLAGSYTVPLGAVGAVIDTTALGRSARQTAERLQELGARRSVLDGLFYAGSIALGAAAGLLGDRWSLGFLAETERQVERQPPAGGLHRPILPSCLAPVVAG